MITFSAISRIGNRENNEDSFVCAPNQVNSFFAVADGLGGHGHGEVASAVVIETAKRTMADAGAVELTALMNSAIMKAQEALLQEQKNRGTFAEMKTTLVALVCNGGHLLFVHACTTSLSCVIVLTCTSILFGMVVG